MKTLDIHTANQKINQTRERVRLIMIVAGIVTAIICSLALVSEAQSIETLGSLNGTLSTEKMVATEFSIQVVGKSVDSVLWPF